MGENFVDIRMKVLLLCSLFAACIAVKTDPYGALQFARFKEQYGKVYKTRSEQFRRATIFANNLKKIEEHNKSGASWKMGVNEFSDLTSEEFEALYTGGYKRLPMPSGNVPAARQSKKAHELPAEVDWRNVTTDVKNQGQCGSCWAFCTTEMIESYYALETGNLLDLSAQQVTSCTPNPVTCGGTGGCMGSIAQLGFTYIQLFGHQKEEDYPYTSGTTMDTGACGYDYDANTPAVGIRGYNMLPSNDQEAVMTHLAEVGPLAVAVYASSWGSYSGGVFTGCSFDANIALNHAVQLVGYGTDESLGDYWLVRNSWGSSWGEGGYIRLQRHSAVQTPHPWMAQRVKEVLAVMSSMSVDSVVSSSISLTLWGLMILSSHK